MRKSQVKWKHLPKGYSRVISMFLKVINHGSVLE